MKVVIQAEREYQVKQGTKTLCTGNAESIRVWMEEKVEKLLGFFVMLQEDGEDEDFRVFLHSDNLEDLSEREIDILKNLNMAVDRDEESNESIIKLLGVSVH